MTAAKAHTHTMPHRQLTTWQKHRVGTVAIARDRRGRYHVVSDAAGRAELADLLARYERIEHESSIAFTLANPPRVPIDASITGHEPMWFSRVTITGGGKDRSEVTWQSDDGTSFRFARKELASVLQKPDRGNDE